MKKILTLAIALLSLPLMVKAANGDEQKNAFVQKAQWIALEKDDSLIVPGVHSPYVKKTFKDKYPGMYRLPVFRKQLTLGRDITSATLMVCGLGHFEAFIDGKKVGNHFLDPAWSAYDKEAYYVTFDVTHMLRSQKNTAELTIALGNGFYNIPRKGYLKVLQSYGAPKVKALLRLVYANGKTEDIVTDASWMARESAVTFSSIYCGETYDARQETATKWQKALITTQGMELKEQQQAVTYFTPITPKRVIKITEGVAAGKITETYDFGQNCSAIPQLTVKGHAGDSIVMLPSELIYENGTVHNTVAKGYHFDYILADGKEHTWQPQFSYAGWRYLQVARPQGTTISVRMIPVHADVAEVGSFNSNDTLLNKIHTLIDWAIRSNTQSVSTDCPTREKLGWLEQAYLMQESMMCRYDMRKMFPKIMDDMATAQHEDGCIPTIAPEYIVFGDAFGDTPEWGSAFIQVPWKYYEWYGDMSLISKHYDRMVRYVDYLTSKASNHIVAYGLGDWYDLGPGAPGYSQLTSNGVTATALYYSNVSLLCNMAALLGKEKDTYRWALLSEEIKQAYNNAFLHTDSGYYDRNSQTANAISLCMGLVPEQYIAQVQASLADDINKQGNTAGDIGYRYVLQALSEAGRNDLIYKIATTTDQPSYAYQLMKGATALTESWQALERVSNNHLMLGHLMQWLYESVGGIRQAKDSKGWQHIIIHPSVLKQCDTSLRVPNGTIRCNYTITNSGYRYEVTIPEGSHATIVLPDKTVKMASGTQTFNK